MDERAWDKVAVSFEEEIFNVPANDRKGLIMARIDALASSTATATDLGCGVGRTLPMLAPRFGHVYAVDVSSLCLNEAAAGCQAYDNITYVHADLTKPRSGYPTADVVLCINTWLMASLEGRTLMIEHTCASVKRGGHLLLVVPSLNSVLLTNFRKLQWNLRDGMSARRAEREAALDDTGLAGGLVTIDKVPTKHYLAEELEALLDEHGLDTLAVEKIEYPWSTEFQAPPRWMKAPYPWDWFVTARRR